MLLTELLTVPPTEDTVTQLLREVIDPSSPVWRGQRWVSARRCSPGEHRRRISSLHRSPRGTSGTAPS